MMRKLFFVLVLVPVVLTAQNPDREIERRIKMLDEGKAYEVKSELPALITKYQNHPGVLYLQGRLALNGAEAAKYYQSILDNFPRSEWADDALYRIYQYYASLGLIRTAGLKLLTLRKEYPNSPYAREKLPTVAQTNPEQEPDVSITTQPPIVKELPIVKEPPEPIKKEPEPKIEVPVAGGNYAIQVGAFSSFENAGRLKSFFEELGYPVEIQNKVRAGLSLHLVWVGRFASADEARRFASEVKTKHKIESIVVTR